MHDRSTDGRSKGTMAQFVREFLSLNPSGWTQHDLMEAVRAQPAFWQQFRRNPDAYHGMIRRLILRGEIEERDGLLYAAEETRITVLARMERFELNRDEGSAGED